MARRYDPLLGHFTTPDPLATQNPSISPWTYCNGDPINFIDPTGKYTEVKDRGNGRYEIVGGSIANMQDLLDLCIYVLNEDNVRTGEIIGKTVTPRSFYNDNEGEWANGSIIDMLDISGIRLLTDIEKSPPNVIIYGIRARNGNFYDFKHTNSDHVYRKNVPDYYRGMHVGIENDGLPVIGSARDIGNIGAGYITGRNGITWENVRKVFDKYQGRPEEKCSVDAQRYGWEIGNALWNQNHKGNSWFDSFISRWF